MRVLLVEDNDTDVYVIRRVLERPDWNVQLDLVRDGAEAVAYIRGLKEGAVPALVLLDLTLPKVGGLDVLKELRNTPCCSGARVIVVTSSDSQVDVDAVNSLGAEAYFRKPADLSAYMKLGDVVKAVLGKPDVH